MMILVNGGSSSGKSAFAESLITEQAKKEDVMEKTAGGWMRGSSQRMKKTGEWMRGSSQGTDVRQQPSWYLATMIAWDEECRERIRKHREMRAKKNFMTIECPMDLSNVEVPKGSRCLLECVSNLAANEMYRQDMEDPSAGAGERILEGIRKIRKNANLLVIVTNDVSGDQGPYSEETETYRELLGGINCVLAEEADEVYEAICGQPVAVKRKMREDTELEERKKDEVLGSRSDITLFVGGAYQGKAKLAMHEAVTEDNRFLLVADGEKSPMEDAFNSEAVLNLHMYIRRLIDAVLGEYDVKNERDRSFCDSICEKIKKKSEEKKVPAKGSEERSFVRKKMMPEEQMDETVSVEMQVEKLMYPYLDMLLEKNPNAVITCDEIGCGIVPVDKTDRLWREMTGDACQYLAARAAKVCRVVCGIPMVLKGGEA